MQTPCQTHHDHHWLGLDALGPGGVAEGVGGLGEVGARRGHAGDAEAHEGAARRPDGRGCSTRGCARFGIGLGARDPIETLCFLCFV